jgi:P27 family predicted phage terminase small subunit
LQGNPGKRSIPDKVPKPKVQAPRKPPHLDGEAAREWRRLVREFGPDGLKVLSKEDRGKLELAAQNYAVWRMAKEQVAEEGLVSMTSNGNLIQSPYVGVMNRAASEYSKILSEFGGSPSARMRVRTAEPEQADELEQFLATGS